MALLEGVMLKAFVGNANAIGGTETNNLTYTLYDVATSPMSQTHKTMH